MAKVSNSFIKFNMPFSFNPNNNKKTSNNDGFIESSQKFLQKLYKLTMDVIELDQEEEIFKTTSNNTMETKPYYSINVSQPVRTSRKSSSDHGQPKGILKASESTTVLHNNQKNIRFHRSISTTARTSNPKEYIGGHKPARHSANAVLSMKQVTFHDRVSRKRYRPQREISDETKESVDQPKTPQTFQHKDRLYARAMNSIRTNKTVPSKVGRNSYDESSEYEASGYESSDIDY